MEHLACTYDALKQFKNARTLRGQSLAAMKMTLGEDHPYTLMLMGNSAAYSGIFGRKNGMAARKEVLERMEKTLGENHISTLTSMTYLALSYVQYGALEKARELQQRAVVGMVEVLGESHQETVAAKKGLSNIERTLALRKGVYWWLR